MTYHTVFDISDRFPEVAIGVIALLGWLAIVALALRSSSRQILRRTAWFWAGAGGVVWCALAAHNIGGPYGLAFGGGFGAAGMAAAVAAWRNLPPAGDRGGVPARSFGPFVAFFLLLFTSLIGIHQFGSVGLASQLASGDTTVVAGTVQDSYGDTWASQCFTVSGHKFCIDNSPSNVGFHQSANDGGPIHDGLQVRVSSIGDVVVRVEIAD